MLNNEKTKGLITGIEEEILKQQALELKGTIEDGMLNAQKKVAATQKEVSSMLIEAGNIAKQDILFQNDLGKTQEKLDGIKTRIVDSVDKTQNEIKESMDSMEKGIDGLRNQTISSEIRDSAKESLNHSLNTMESAVKEGRNTFQTALEGLKTSAVEKVQGIKESVQEYAKNLLEDTKKGMEDLSARKQELKDTKLFPESGKDTAAERKAERSDIRDSHIGQTAVRKVRREFMESHTGFLAKKLAQKADRVDEKIIQKERLGQAIDEAADKVYNATYTIGFISSLIEKHEKETMKAEKTLITEEMPAIYTQLTMAECELEEIKSGIDLTDITKEELQEVISRLSDKTAGFLDDITELHKEGKGKEADALRDLIWQDAVPFTEQLRDYLNDNFSEEKQEPDTIER